MRINQDAIDNMKVGDKIQTPIGVCEIIRIRHVKMAGRVWTAINHHTGERHQGLVHQQEWDDELVGWKSMKRREK